MLQRKQTLFLIIVIALFTPLFFMNLASYEFLGFKAEGDGLLSISALKATNGQTVYPLTILLSLIVSLSAITIGLFKKSALQLRLSIMLIILIIGFMILEGYTIYEFYDKTNSIIGKVPSFNSTVGIASLIPIPALFFAYMAFKGIARDMFILRSFNKMR